jgi:predicted ATPase
MTNYINSVTILHDKFPSLDHYPFTLPVLNQTKNLILNTPTTLFVGENGTGKSTLLEAVALACGIHIWRTPWASRYQVNPYESELHTCIKPEWSNGVVHGAFFGSDIFKDFTHFLVEWAISDPGQLNYFGGKSLVTQSHGQSMMSFFRSRYKLKGIYFLDEPETALSPKSQLELLEIIGENSQAGHGQFIIATHSPILLACEGAKIFSFDHAPIKVIDYEETDHYQVYKQFLNKR